MLALVLNMVLNATFIFGWFGLPKMGVTGIALATVIARFVEAAVCIWAGLRLKEVKLSPLCYFMRSKLLFKDFVKYSLPAVGNEFVWGAAFVSYSVILGHLGEDIVAANSVVNVARNLSSIVCFGMAYGGAILLGKQIGEGRLELAGRNARRLMLSTIEAGVLGSIFMVLLRPVLPLLAELSPAAADFRNYLLYINAYSIVGATVNTVLICGIFRSGGDSKFGFLCDGFFMWFVMIPLGFLSAFVFKLSPLAVYFILYLDEFIKMPVIILHHRRGKCLNKITGDEV